jgi:hypothetical protein
MEEKRFHTYMLKNIPIELFSRMQEEAREKRKISVRTWMIEAIEEKLAREGK